MFIITLETCAELIFFTGHVVSMYKDYLLLRLWYQMNGRLLGYSAVVIITCMHGR